MTIIYNLLATIAALYISYFGFQLLEEPAVGWIGIGLTVIAVISLFMSLTRSNH